MMIKKSITVNKRGKITGEENATNENKEIVIEIEWLFMYLSLFQIVLDLKNKMLFIDNNFP